MSGLNAKIETQNHRRQHIEGYATLSGINKLLMFQIAAISPTEYIYYATK